MGHGVMANCILDHNGKDNSDVGYAIVVIGVSQGYQFANLSIHYGKLYFEGNNNISLVNGKLGQNTGWEIAVLIRESVIQDQIREISERSLSTSRTQMVFTLVGESEANLAQGKLAASTPIGKALFGKSKGEVVDVNAPAGIIKFEILDISL